MNWSPDDERALWAMACRDSFWQFFNYAFGAGQNPRAQSWVDPAIHKPICDWYEGHIKAWLRNRGKGVPQQTCLAVLVPREYGKTTIITKAGQLWLHLLNPDLSTYTGSESVARAWEFLSSLKSVMDGSDEYARFTWLYGVWKDSKRAWSTGEVEHAARRATSRSEPSLGTFGVEKGLTGTHPDALFFDDPTSYEAIQASTNWLRQVNDCFDSLIPVLTADGLMVLPGTRYGDGDHFGRLFHSDGIASITGGEMPDGLVAKPSGKWHVYFLQGRTKEGKPTYEKKWPKWRLDEYEQKNNMRFAAQIMNDPSSSVFNPLTTEEVRLMMVKPLTVPKNLRYSIHIDTAFRYPERVADACESVMEVWGHATDGTGTVYYIEGYGSDEWTGKEFNDQLIIILKRLRAKRTWNPLIVGGWPFAITDELAQSGKQGTWELTLESWCKNAGIPCPTVMTLRRNKRDKKQRIITALTHWTAPNGNVRLVEGAPGLDSLVGQMTKVLTAKLLDWADAAADVFAKDIYSPPWLGKSGTHPPDPTYPEDPLLRPRMPTTTEAYDAYHNRRQEEYDVV